MRKAASHSQFNKALISWRGVRAVKRAAHLTPPALEAPLSNQERPERAGGRYSLIPLQRGLSQQVARIHARLEPVPSQSTEPVNDRHSGPHERLGIER